MKPKHFLLVLFTLLVLSGCGDSKESKSSAPDYYSDPMIDVVHEDGSNYSEPDTLQSDFAPVSENVPSGSADKELLRQELNEKYSPSGSNFYKKVPNDVTGKWRMFVCYGSSDILDYIQEYCDAYVESRDEVHIVINLYLNTTAVINYLTSDLLSVSVYELTDKEYTDANKIASGMLYGSYLVHLDTGEVEKIEDDY